MGLQPIKEWLPMGQGMQRVVSLPERETGRKQETRGGTVYRSYRFEVSLWTRIQKAAVAEGVFPEAFIRQAIVEKVLASEGGRTAENSQNRIAIPAT